MFLSLYIEKYLETTRKVCRKSSKEFYLLQRVLFCLVSYPVLLRLSFSQRCGLSWTPVWCSDEGIDCLTPWSAQASASPRLSAPLSLTFAVLPRASPWPPLCLCAQFHHQILASSQTECVVRGLFVKTRWKGPDCEKLSCGNAWWGRGLVSNEEFAYKGETQPAKAPFASAKMVLDSRQPWTSGSLSNGILFLSIPKWTDVRGCYQNNEPFGSEQNKPYLAWQEIQRARITSSTSLLCPTTTFIASWIMEN